MPADHLVMPSPLARQLTVISRDVSERSLVADRKGKMVVDVGPVGPGQTKVEATAGQTLWLPKGVRYHYHFPAEEGTEYVPVCIPGFSPGIAGREEDGTGEN